MSVVRAQRQQDNLLLNLLHRASNVHLLVSLRRRWSEWALAFTLLVIGIVMTYNTDAMHSERYNQLTSVAPGGVWAVVTFMTGFSRMSILYMNGRWSGSYMARVVSAIVSMAIWYNFALLAWVNIDNVLLITLPLAFLPLLLEGLAVVFALQERINARASLYLFVPSE